MQNLTIVESTDRDVITNTLPPTKAHITNGTYAMDESRIVPTTLCGFRYVNSFGKLPFILAVNSDQSMQALGKNNFEPQLERANKVAIPLARRFPRTQIYVVFFDEKTPYNLYSLLYQKGVTGTLHKWGYGTDRNAPKIEGQEFFTKTFGIKLPDDTKPMCYYNTSFPDKDKPQDITVVDLRWLLTLENGIFFGKKRLSCDYRYTLFAAGAVVLAGSLCANLIRSGEYSNPDETEYTCGT